MWRLNDNERLTGTDLYETVLRLHVKPAPSDGSLTARYRKSWAGIMTSLPVSQDDRKRDQSFEIMVKVVGGAAGRGKLRVQMGRMREDICVAGAPPDGRANKEDTSLIWRDNRDTTLDKGLDRLPNEKESYWIPDGLGGWDSLGYNDPRLGEWKLDPAKDLFRLYDDDNDVANWKHYKYPCRLERDGFAMATEDINNDGTVEISTIEQYHEFIIDLADTNSPYIDRTAESKLVDRAWRRYRLPLHEKIVYKDTVRREVNLDSSRADDWNNIRTVRLIWDGIDYLSEENQLILSSMQFVGNQWEAIRDARGKSKVDVSVIGTRENAPYESSVMPLVNDRIPRQRDERNVYQPEQSLRLNFHHVGPGQVCLAQKNYSYQKLDLASYETLTLEVHGMDTTKPGASGVLLNGEAQFSIRFGTDTTTYYEYRQKINAGWNNFIHINLKQLSELKREWLRNHPNDSIDTCTFDRSLYIKAPKGRQPSFSNIIWMAVGVVRDSASADSTMLDGLELWVNELKVVGIKEFNGWSSRLNLSTQWADFLTLSGDLTYQGGDFRTMTETNINLGDSKLAGNLSLSTGLDKFMPKEWGVAIPVGGSITTSLIRPQLRPNTDIYLTDNDRKPDGFLEMVKDIMSGSRRGDSATRAEHPAVDLLLQRLQTEFNYSENTNTARRGQRPDPHGDSDYVNSDKSQSYAGGVRYNLTPKDPPSWTKWRPMDSIQAKWLPNKFKEIELTFLPKNASLNLANASFTRSEEHRFESEATPPTDRQTRNFTLNHGLQLDFTPVSPIIDLSYSITVNRDFPDSLLTSVGGKEYPFMRDHIVKRNADLTWRDYYILDQERSRSQRFKMTFNPQLFDWLTNSADYSANYDGSMAKWGSDNSKEYINAKVNSSVSFNSSLTIASLLKASQDSSLLNKMVSGVKKGCDYIGFSSVNFTYSMSSDLKNDYLGSDFLRPRTSASDFLAYQLGVKDRGPSDIFSGNMDDRTAFGGMRYRSVNNDVYDYYKNDNRTVSRNYSVSTGLGITKPIDLQFSSISLKWSDRYSLIPDTNFYDSSNSFPEFSVGARTSVLEKITLLAKYVQGMGLSSNYSFKRGWTKSSSSSGKAVTRGFDLSPLVSVDGTVKKWPIRFSFQHTLGHDERRQGSDATTTDRNGDNMEVNYDIPAPAQEKKINFLKWSIPIKGKTAMAVLISRDRSKTITRGTTTAENTNFSVKPYVSYDFTNNVTGRLEYTGSRSTEMGGAITTSNIFGGVAEIRF
jgi:cell surface protein SprA